MPEQFNIFDDLLVFLLGIVLPFISGVRSREGFKNITFTRDIRRRFYLSNSLVQWAAAAFILGYWIFLGRPITSIGLGVQPGEHMNLAWRLSILLVILYLSDILFSVRNKAAIQATLDEQGETTPFLPESFSEFPSYGFMCLTAGICEEILYRGYMVTYFLPHTTGAFPWMAIIFPALLFSLAHYYQGWHAVAKILVLSMLLAGIYIASGSLWIGMAIHFLIDLAGGILAVALKDRGSRIEDR